MKNNLLLLLLFLLSLSAKAQMPVLDWIATYDGALTGKDVSRSVTTDPSGNVYVTGTSFNLVSNGSFSTIRYDPDGAEIWVHHYEGGQSSNKNKGEKIVVDSWGNIYAGGTVAIASGDLGLLKYDSTGFIWAENYTPSWFGSYNDAGVDLVVDPLGECYLIGVATSTSGNLDDVYVVKADSSGDVIWEDQYTGASDADYPTGIAVAPSGNAFAVSASFNFWGSASRDITTISYDTAGNHDWIAYYDGPDSDIDYPTFILANDNGNTIVSGTEDAGTQRDFICLERNSTGTELWSLSYNGSANTHDTAIVVRYLPDGTVVVTGRTKELVNSVTYDAITTMVIDSGNIVWSDSFFGSDNIGAVPKAMVTDLLGNIYICGYETTSSELKNGVILKYDAAGNLLWQESFDYGNAQDDMFYDITLDPSYNIIVTGQTYTSSTNANFLTVKYAQSIVLSVELMDFWASVEENTIILSWTTSSEVNNSGFVVERTTSPADYFETIGWVDGNGSTSSASSYEYKDGDARSGIRYYYRLKQVDHDGGYEYSPLVSAEIGEESFYFSAYPNPYTESTSIHYVLLDRSKVTIKAINLLGQIVSVIYDGTQDAGEHVQDFSAQNSGYCSGLYTIQIQVNNELYSLKVLEEK